MRLNALRVGILGICFVAVAWLPLLAFAGSTAVQSPLTEASIYYRNELLLVACFFTLGLGAYLAARWNPPVTLAALMRRNSTSVNAWTSVGGGVSAFLYVLHNYNSLTLFHPVWVLGCGFATPIALQVAAPTLFQLLSKWLNRGGTANDK